MGYVVLADNGLASNGGIRFINGSWHSDNPLTVNVKAPINGAYTFYGDPADGRGYYEVLGTNSSGKTLWRTAVGLAGGQTVRFANTPFTSNHRGQYGLWVTGGFGFDPVAYVTRILG